MKTIVISVIIVILLIGLYLHLQNEKFNGEPCGVKPMPNISYYRPNMIDNPDRVPFKYLQGVDIPYPITKPQILVGYHYTQWCPMCQIMTPVWNSVKENINHHFNNVTFLENDEGLNVTPGVDYYPYIRKYVTGRAYTYTGPAEYEKLRAWILDPVHQYLIYGFR